MKLIASVAAFLLASQLVFVSAQEAAVHIDLTAPDGQARRFDGYSDFVITEVPADSFSPEALTVNVVLAAETYPMMQVGTEEDAPVFATICGNLDEKAKKGFAWQLSSQGDLRFRYG